MKSRLALAGMFGLTLLAAPQFEVAAVRPASADTCPIDVKTRRNSKMFKVDAARVDIRCLTFGDLLEDAFSVLSNRIVKPAWTTGRDAPLFDISAKLPAGTSQDEIPAMLQALLVERFKLAFHRETGEEPGYGLAVAKSGLKAIPAQADVPALPPAANSAASGMMNLNGVKFRTTVIPDQSGYGFTEMLNSPRMGTVISTTNADGTKEHLEAHDITFAGLADLITIRTGQDVPVVDVTGYQGRYQMVLEVTYPPVPAFRARPARSVDLSQFVSNVRFFGGSDVGQIDAFQAPLKKFGLQLEPRKTPVETIVVDHLEKTPGDN